MNTSNLTVRIAKRVQEATDIVCLELIPTDLDFLPAFTAGAHIDIEIKPGVVRQYSLCNNPSEQNRYQIAVLRDPQSRGGSIGVHEELKEGQAVSISAPRNLFELGTHANTLLLAGGIGITPILCMAEELSARGAEFTMHYGARSQDRAAFLKRISGSSFGTRVHTHFDDGEDEQKLNLRAVLGACSSDTHLYVCGPTGFIEAVKKTAQELGWATERVHLEYFGAAPVEPAGNGNFEVKLARSGKTIAVEPHETISQALFNNGIDHETSCCQGACGSCMTRVLEGEVDHRDKYLTDKEKAESKYMLICCSRAKSPVLVLDM